MLSNCTLALEVNDTPDILHGDWIKVERKKINNKSNNRGVNGLFKGVQL